MFLHQFLLMKELRPAILSVILYSSFKGEHSVVTTDLTTHNIQGVSFHDLGQKFSPFYIYNRIHF